MLNLLQSFDYLLCAVIAYFVFMFLWNSDIGGIKTVISTKTFTIYGIFIILLFAALVFPIALMVMIIFFILNLCKNERKKKITKA